ncbi:MAG TPA: adenylate/guanylate cyclase domain-containing protein [Candidatus Nitrosotenuis sp.]|jgi:class 3 adenylate cyclase
MELDLAFDSEKCRETYRRLAGIYGHNISDTGLPDVINANFFFVDVVGLSDPSLSVKNQMTKIDVLNRLIKTCSAFRSSKIKKIIMPTGDGMVITFLLNPELPLNLSIELHQQIHQYNQDKAPNERIGVRIGLSSGPVFISNDINDNKNMWGPGIVIARRVMDIGNESHILIADRLAEELMVLKDEYRTIIKPISDYTIKHDQTIKIYSAYSKDFGNPHLPDKVIEFIERKNRNISKELS